MRSKPSRLSLVRRFSCALVIGCQAATLTAQCTNPVELLLNTSGTNGIVMAVAEWDPDGAGPATPLWVIGGAFSRAGSLTTSGLAAFDPATSTWSSLGGANNAVRALAVLANGNLLAAGDFTQIGGINANRIARYDGATWTPLSSGCNGLVRAFVERPNGEIVAGGDFSTAGGIAASRIASWNGSSWQPLGTGVDQPVAALILGPGGTVVAGGGFTTAGGVSTPHVARWDGSTWTGFGSVLGTPAFPTAVNGLTTTQNGDLVAVGKHSVLLGSEAASARWNGSAWVAMGGNAGTKTYSAVTTLANGDVVASSIEPTGNGNWTYNVDRWFGTNWGVLTYQHGPLHALRELSSGGLLVGGDFGSLAANSYRDVARWDGTSWHGLLEPGGSPPQTKLYAMTTRPNGDVVAAYQVGNTTCELALWNGTEWSVLAALGNVAVTALGSAPNGDVVVAGTFASIGGVFANYIARWNGTTWAPLGSGVAGVRALLWAPNGDLYAGLDLQYAAPFSNGIVRWNGSTWSVVGSGLLGAVHCLHLLPNGDLVAGGDFNHDGANNWMGKVARWNGTSWSSYGFGMALSGCIRALALLPDGDLVAGGFTGTPPHLGTPTWSALLWRWNGTWTAAGPIAGTHVSSLVPFPNGDLLVGGSFHYAGGVAAANIARWNGGNWSAIGSGLPGTVATAAWRGNDELWFGGVFGGTPSSAPALARMTTSCPATVSTLGVACVGPAGSVVLTSESLPWIGSAVHSRATGFAANTLAIHVLGLTSIALPLPAILPQAVAGCSLFVSPDVLELHLPVNGALDLSVPVHPSIAFVGHPFYQQVVSLDFTTGDIGPVTSSNALEFVKGHF